MRPALGAVVVLLLVSILAVEMASGGEVQPVDPAQPGVDQFPSRGRVNVTVTLPGRPATTEDIVVSSQGQPDAVVERGALQGTSIPTEIVAMRLIGNSPSLGPVVVSVGREYGLQPSRGQVTNVVLDQDRRLAFGESFFDVFFEIFAPQSPIGPVTARNDNPLRMSAEIFDLPPNRPKETPPAAFNIDHFKCYNVSRAKVRRKSLSKRVLTQLEQGRKPSRKVQLLDQFEDRSETVRKAVLLCNPAAKTFGQTQSQIQTSKNHLVCYRITRPTENLELRALGIKNQFGATTVDVVKRQVLCLPSTKRVLRGKRRRVPAPVVQRPLSHYKCYAIRHRGQPLPFQVKLSDQFESRQDMIKGPERVCNPVMKNKTLPTNFFAHMTCHPFVKRKLRPRFVAVQNQFGVDILKVRRRDSVCVPTHKTICSEYAEEAKVNLTGPGGVPAGTINRALHVPYEGDQQGACP